MRSGDERAGIRSGATLGRYEVEEHLGCGRLGAVYRARDTGLSTVVAIRSLEPLAGAAARARLAAAAPSLLELRHPSLVGVLAAGEHDGVPYLVMEHVDGVSLATSAVRRGLLPSDAMRILDAIAAGVDHAHCAGVVHGDLRPASVLLAAGGQPRVGDLGVVPLLDRSDRPAGSPEYTAPEQAPCGDVTVAADVYSFAAVAHELLVGQPPFGFGPPDQPVPAPGPWPATEAVLWRGLALEPADRWASCTRMAQALRQALRKDGSAATRPGRDPGRAARRWLKLAGASAAIGFAVLAGVLLESANQPAPTPITLSERSVGQGGAVTVSGTHLPPGQLGTVDLEGGHQEVGAFRADRRGNLTVRVAIPRRAAPGDHRVSLCWDGTCHGSARLSVTRR